MKYETVIGLEVHLQLYTQTKLFCSCKIQFASPENSLTCPVCLGLPGSLPVINRKAIEYALKVALALDCSVGSTVKFDRKNYYYPDLPKNYQISQFDMPLALKGKLAIKTNNQEKVINIRRVHLEEDAGKLIHESIASLVDYNRCGVPLLEIVTEPDINSPDEAYNYLVGLKTLLKYLDVSDCDMEKGSLRCDANISLRLTNSEELGTKTELKNMNSFRAVKIALESEARRQEQLLNNSQRVIQETRLWDEERKETVSMRSKEEASDYRYFPEPDLVPFKIEASRIDAAKMSLPELPDKKIQRFINQFGITNEEAQFLIVDPDLSKFFEDCTNIYSDVKTMLNWIKGALSYEINQRNKNIKELQLTPQNFISLIKLVSDDTLSTLSAKSVLTLMLDKNLSPQDIIKEKNIAQVSDEDTLNKLIEQVIAINKTSVDAFLAGKTNAIMFLVGQVMKKSNGQANPKKVKELLEQRLSRGGNK